MVVMKIKLDNVGKLSTMPKYSININSFCLICEKIPKSLTSFLKSPSLYLMSCSNLYNQTRKCLYSLSPLSHNSSPFRFLQSASVATTHPTSLAKIINDHILKQWTLQAGPIFLAFVSFHDVLTSLGLHTSPLSCCTSYLLPSYRFCFSLFNCPASSSTCLSFHPRPQLYLPTICLLQKLSVASDISK